MKKTVLMFALMVTAFAVRAQYTFPLPELVKLTSKNASDFETVMLEKDYSVQSKQSTATTKLYTSDKPGASGKQYTFTRQQIPNAAVSLSFTTTDKKYYLDLKTKLAASGYKFVKEESKPVNGVAAVWYHYSNGIYTVSICSYTTDVMWFAVQVHLG